MKSSIYKILLIVFTLSSTGFYCYAQGGINPGKVIGDVNFDCDKNDGKPWNNFKNNVGKICDSKNELEIRLLTGYSPHAGSDIIILTYNNGTWDAQKITYSRAMIGHKVEYATLELDGDNKEQNNLYFKQVFDSLKANNIFLLPDQNTLKLSGIVHDGLAFRLLFKVGDKFRTYFFHSPASLIEDNPNVIELKQYTAIVKWMRIFFE